MVVVSLLTPEDGVSARGVGGNFAEIFGGELSFSRNGSGRA